MVNSLCTITDYHFATECLVLQNLNCQHVKDPRCGGYLSYNEVNCPRYLCENSLEGAARSPEGAASSPEGAASSPEGAASSPGGIASTTLAPTTTIDKPLEVRP